MKKLASYLATFLCIAGIYGQTPALIPKLKDGKWGYINPQGAWVIQPSFDYAEPFEEGLAIAGMGVQKIRTAALGGSTEYLGFRGKLGLIDNKGAWVLPCEYIEINQLKDGMRLLGMGEINEAYYDFDTYLKRYVDSYGYADINGKLLPLKEKYVFARDFKEGYAIVGVGEMEGYNFLGKMGIINRQGAEIVAPKHSLIEDFSNGRALFLKADMESEDLPTYGYLNREGQEVIPPKFEEATDFSEGLAVVNVLDSYGYIDTTGKMAISKTYYSAGKFNEGMAVVETNEKKDKKKANGYYKDPIEALFNNIQHVISPTGKILYTNRTPDFRLSDFEGGVCFTTTTDGNGNYKMGLLNKEFKTIFQPDNISLENDKWVQGYFPVSKEGKYGVLKKDGSYQIQPSYQYLGPLIGGLMLAMQDNKLFYIDINGKEWKD